MRSTPSPEDLAVSRMAQSYWVNFAKTGDPNGPGLPAWPAYDTGRRLIIDVDTRAEREKVRARYEFLDQFYLKK